MMGEKCTKPYHVVILIQFDIMARVTALDSLLPINLILLSILRSIF